MEINDNLRKKIIQIIINASQEASNLCKVEKENFPNETISHLINALIDELIYISITYFMPLEELKMIIEYGYKTTITNALAKVNQIVSEATQPIEKTNVIDNNIPAVNIWSKTNSKENWKKLVDKSLGRVII